MLARVLVGCLAAVVAATGCGSAGSDGAETRTVLVDFDHDEYVGSLLAMFPRRVTVAPGDTVVFRQEWTGEPHTVTMGKLFDDLTKIDPTVRDYVAGGGTNPVPDLAPAIQAEFDQRFNQLPFAFSPDFRVLQNVGQPCFLDEDLPPRDPETPCPRRPQPAFNGRQSYYSSGIIRYEGDGANRFEVPLTDDIAPGDYAYYCAVHGLQQSGVITVVARGDDIPSQGEVNRAARREVERAAAPLIEARETAEKGRYALDGEQLSGNLAGWLPMDPTETIAFGNEFIPSRVEVPTGTRVEWHVLGIHTVSFNVPRYLPVLTFASGGRVTLNELVAFPQGGWPGQLGQTVESAVAGGAVAGVPAMATPPAHLDAGRWDGTGFVSTGLLSAVEQPVRFAVTFTNPGSYKLACLIHPEMVGEVRVS